ncbi:sulfatase/phosphatase domain-containing protein [Streptomyces sp. NPDC029554]|uniref:sulfatase/phosphatase domain-containing protein n=1 Tax=Streptomyces sp. NPDC029554 TaxID=3155126 RepID=UPI003404E466
MSTQHLRRERPLSGIKRNLSEGGVRAPLIARRPGTVRVGTTERHIPLTDLLPTFAQLGGTPTPGDIDGMSVIPLFTGPNVQRHDHLYRMRNDPYISSLYCP